MFGKNKNTTTTTGATHPNTAHTTTNAGANAPVYANDGVNRQNRGPKKAKHLLAIFLTLFALGAVQLGLLAHIVHKQNNDELNFVSSVNRRFKYALFVAVWTVVLSLVWLGVSLVATVFRFMHHTIFLVITAILWLIAAALLEDVLGEFSDAGTTCSAFLGRGICREIRAVRALSWVLFALPLLAIPLIWHNRHHDRKALREKSAHNNVVV